MKPKVTNHRQGRLFEQRLSDLLNPNHPLLLLAQLIDWEDLERELSIHFHDEIGAPAKPVRLITGIFMLQHMSGLSDENVVRGWVENPYWQLFCGYDFLQWKFPINFSSLSRWRTKIGKTGMKKILAATVECAINVDLIKERDLENVIVDTTVMPKNISFPTDAKLYYKSIVSLVRFAKKLKIPLRQTYKFLSKKALRLTSKYAHARKMKQAKREARRLKTYLGRIFRELQNKAESNKDLKDVLGSTLKVIGKILQQQRTDKNKIYSVHEPSVECISKGKAHKKYEFGCKASLVLTHKKGLVLSCEAHHGNPFDGHTLKQALFDAEANSGKRVKRTFVDKGYRGHKIKDKEVFISGAKKRLSPHFKKLLKRRQAIEPIIGHMKADGKLGRNYLKGHLGDKLNAILCGIGQNIRLLLNFLLMKYA